MNKSELEMYDTLLKKIDVLLDKAKTDAVKGHLQCAKAEILAAIQMGKS